MRLAAIHIENFRRIESAYICFSPASFIIGQNNCGKSSVVKAIDVLLGNKKLDVNDFRLIGERSEKEIIIDGTFNEISPEIASSRGFKARVIDGEYRYKKTFSLGLGGKVTEKIECMEIPWQLKDAYADVKTGHDLIAAGIESERVSEALDVELDAKLVTDWPQRYGFLDVVAEIDESKSPVWVKNPGGIAPNVISKLPELVHVPSLTSAADIDTKGATTIMSRVLAILFEDLVESSENSVRLRQLLEEFEREMHPSEEGSMLHTLIGGVNAIIARVFPECGISIAPELQDVKAVLRPKYEVQMFSNVTTDVDRQGTGLLRTTIFSMLRYHSQLKRERRGITKSLIVAFEEPELFMHPIAANLLRDTIYELGQTDQIVCTTHSPWMVDLSKDTQSLVKMVPGGAGGMTALNYGVSSELERLAGDDKTAVKMMQVFDDELSRVFFCDHVVVVEGDSELIAIKVALAKLPEETRLAVLSRSQVVRARGKAAIISLVKYLQALGIQPFVIHDRDRGMERAEGLNQHIRDAVGDDDRICMLEECLENALGYDPPSSNKPFRAYRASETWQDWASLPDAWRNALELAFAISI